MEITPDPPGAPLDNGLHIDQDALDAGIDLIGRTGARSFEVGFVNDTPPHRWYAHAQYEGARIIAEDHPGPVEAIEALARRLLRDAKCIHCGKIISIMSAPDPNRCRWTRHGMRWTPVNHD
jgi:hypothetical protein